MAFESKLAIQFIGLGSLSAELNIKRGAFDKEIEVGRRQGNRGAIRAPAETVPIWTSGADSAHKALRKRGPLHNTMAKNIPVYTVLGESRANLRIKKVYSENLTPRLAARIGIPWD